MLDAPSLIVGNHPSLVDVVPVDGKLEFAGSCVVKLCVFAGATGPASIMTWHINLQIVKIAVRFAVNNVARMNWTLSLFRVVDDLLACAWSWMPWARISA